MIASLLGRLKLWQKLALLRMLAAIIVVPLLVLFVQMNSSQKEKTEQELAGIETSHALLRVIQYTQQHRGTTTRMLGGNESVASQRQQLQERVDKEIQDATAVLTGSVKDEKYLTAWQEVVQEWRSLSQAVAQRAITGAQSFSRHTTLITSMLDVLDLNADHFGFSYEAEAAPHHLMTAVLVHLPQLMEVLGKARARGSLFLGQKTLTEENRGEIAALISLSQTHSRNMRRALNKVGGLAPEIQTDLAREIEAAYSAMDKAAQLATTEIITAATLTYDSTAYFQHLTEAIDTQVALNKAALEQLNRLLAARTTGLKRTERTMLAAVVILWLLTLALSTAISRAVTRAVSKAVGLAERIAKGDLTAGVETTSRDEIGQLLRALTTMRDGLTEMVAAIRSAVENVDIASQKMATTTEQLSSGAQEQASALEETAASMEEMTATVKQNAESARQANQLATDAHNVAEQGGSVVSAAVASMSDITSASKKITEISSVIDEIAFQTNLLALNAAVEAARAGEQGRGFAVVAAEVRNLAQRSASAAKEIKGLIQTAGQKVEDGAALVNTSGQTLQEIVSGVKQVSRIVSEIAAASQEQAQGIEQVNKTVTQMDSVTQENAAQTEELSSTAQALATQAQQLQALVSRFKLQEKAASAVETEGPDHAQARAAKRSAVMIAKTSTAIRPHEAFANGHDKPYVNGKAHSPTTKLEEF